MPSDPRLTEVNLPWAKGIEIFAYTIDNVLTKEECEAWIAETEEIGYEVALLNVGGGDQVLCTDRRQSSRCIVDSNEKAEFLWNKIKVFIPEVRNGMQVHIIL